ncbi:MAG: hypothetical protein ACSHYF_17395 [Verrucomicrobiaceae bacterium]
MNARVFLSIAAAAIGVVSANDKVPKKIVPELGGQPVFLTFGMILVHPKGVEPPPKGYEGAMQGKEPLAIVKVDGKIVGEIYGNPLRGKAKDEADDMRGSADDSPVISLLKRDSAKRTDFVHEITTLRLDVPSKLGKPWIIHSLYFPKGDHSVTFKFVAGEKDFERVLPIFDAMLFTEEFMRKAPNGPKPDKDKQATEQGDGHKR